MFRACGVAHNRRRQEEKRGGEGAVACLTLGQSSEKRSRFLFITANSRSRASSATSHSGPSAPDDDDLEPPRGMGPPARMMAAARCFSDSGRRNLLSRKMSSKWQDASVSRARASARRSASEPPPGPSPESSPPRPDRLPGGGRAQTHRHGAGATGEEERR